MIGFVPGEMHDPDELIKSGNWQECPGCGNFATPRFGFTKDGEHVATCRDCGFHISGPDLGRIYTEWIQRSFELQADMRRLR